MWQEFRDFLMKGNLVEIAVGLLMAVAFKDVTDAFVNGIISPIVGSVLGAPSFADKTLKIGDGVLAYGAFIDAVISFVIVGFVLFLVVKAYNAAKARQSKGGEDAEVAEDVAVLREIRDLLQARNG